MRLAERQAEIVAAYERLGSTHAVGRELGLRYQSVHKFLRRIGHPVKPINVVTDAERETIRAYYGSATFEDFDLSELAQRLGRPRTSICRIAREMGLSKQGRSTKKICEAGALGGKGKWTRSPHPRGMRGKKHTAETLAKVAHHSKRNWDLWKETKTGPMSPENSERRSARSAAMMAARPAHKSYSRARGGRREDLGDIWFRSSWEANYARYLNMLLKMGAIDGWEYEPETFWFENIKRGTRSYRPDFRIWHRRDQMPEYIELKGWVVAKDHTKWRRMAKYHPHIKLTIVGAKEYYAIRDKWANTIPAWEGKRPSR